MAASTLMTIKSGEAEEREDAAIEEALAAGDYREAITRCARTHGAAIGRLCMALVGSQADAEELAQETLVEAHKSFHTYRAEGTARAFLFGIARHLCARHLETRTRREAKLRLVHNADAPSNDTGDMLERCQRAEQARAALRELRPTERDAVVLRFQSGLSFREVAASCGVDEATARKRVSRAVVRLRALLGDA